MQNTATTTRDQLLAAAQQVVMAGGANALTLDAVARAAGVSKGGLLYHFPNKEALIIGMIDALCTAFEAALVQAQAADPQPNAPGRFVRAYVVATFAPNREALELSAALAAATANNPSLVAPFQERMAHWQAQIEQDGIDPALATAIRLAADGLWFADFGGFAAPTGQHRQQVLATLLALTKGTHA